MNNRLPISKKGFSLAELMIVSVIIVLIIGAVTTVLLLGGKLFKQGSETADSMTQASTVEEWLQDSLSISSAYGVSEITAPPDAYRNFQTVFYFDDEGTLHIDGTSTTDIPTTMTLDNIREITLNFRSNADTSRVTATYTILSKTGRSLKGSVVMNNVLTLEQIVQDQTITSLSLSEDNVGGVSILKEFV